MAGRRELADDAFGIGAFAHALDIGRFHLVSKGLLDRQTADVVAVGPAVVADRADIDEADLELVGGLGPGGEPESGRGGKQQSCAFHGSPLLVLRYIAG